MREEYGIIIINMLVFLGFYAVLFLIIDLFDSGAFGMGMILVLIGVSIIGSLAFIIQAFRLNFEVKRK